MSKRHRLKHCLLRTHMRQAKIVEEFGEVFGRESKEVAYITRKPHREECHKKGSGRLNGKR